MPRYFFHYRDGVEFVDHEGTELPGLEEARSMAVRSSGEAIQDLGSRFWAEGDWLTWVTDESGATICSLRFSGSQVQPKPSLVRVRLSTTAPHSS